MASNTQQQFLDYYNNATPEMQQQIYNSGNREVKAMLDAYNAQNTTSWSSTSYTSNQTNQTSNQTQYTNDPSINYGDWNYWEDSERRQQEIVNNLNEAYAQNPERFSDWSSFAQNYNYDYSWRSDMERETMRNWYEQNVQSQQQGNDARNVDYYLWILMNTWQLTWEWAAMDAARTRYQNRKYLSWMTPDQIISAISSKTISAVWQEMQDLKQYSPALYAQVQADMQWQTTLDDINSVWDSIYSWLTWTESNWYYTNYDMSTKEYVQNASIIKQYNEQLYKKIEWLWWDTAAYVAIVASMLQNPAVQASKNEVEDLEWEVRKIQEQIYTIWDTAREKLWSEAPEDLVSAYISQQTKNLQNQLRTAQNGLLVAQWKLNNQLSEVETMIDSINNWIKLYWEGWTWSWDYQYISGTKYQKAWYFNKKTWEFIPLGSTWTSWWWTSWGTWWWTWYTGTYNYQDDSDARLKEIANNLNNLYNSNPELFKDRATFDNYFNYSKRSAKQKAILDAFYTQKKWILANAWRLWTWTGTWTATDEDSLVNAIKKDLLSRTVNFTSSTMKDTYWKKYQQAKSWDEDTTNDYLQEIWKISSLSEMKTMLSHLSKDANKKALLSSLKTKVVSELQAIKDKTERSNKFKEYAKKLWLDAVTLANLRGIKVN